MALKLTKIPSGATTTAVATVPGRILSALVTTVGSGSGNVSLVDGYGASDLAVDGTNPLKVTSASHNFVASDVGKSLQVISGSGFTASYYPIVSVASNAAILASSPAATSTGSGVYVVGSGLTIGLVDATSGATVGKQYLFGGQYGVPFSQLYVTGVAGSPVFTLVYE